MTLAQSKLINALLSVAVLIFFIMAMVALNQRDDARAAFESAADSAASLVVVVILAPQNADGENVARDQVQRGLSL
ncbi:hypothetical protein H3221_016595 [Pseudomonas sp. LMG 31766]|jgi:hypothetical protein|uniref:Uncharacterized protein n=1 Tax=Pseudomonas chaetocerotis TaxID=2758695 RepID=A0A931D4R5_9PSED|nr:hypothetical protein [Pseudomonas chaetocerotis]MBZ9666364.1 hypothetical protein [Pseudomonas chaetocerotis]